jgi:hypothetical protein
MRRIFRKAIQPARDPRQSSRIPDLTPRGPPLAKPASDPGCR